MKKQNIIKNLINASDKVVEDYKNDSEAQLRLAALIAGLVAEKEDFIELLLASEFASHEVLMLMIKGFIEIVPRNKAAYLLNPENMYKLSKAIIDKRKEG